MIEVRAKSTNNVGTFATEDIEEGTIILRECPLFPDLQENSSHFNRSPAPTGDAEIDAEIRSLQRVGAMAAKTHEEAMSRMERTGNASFHEVFPPQARAALDRLSLHAYQHKFNMQPESIKKKWLSLHDAFQDVPMGIESSVGIFGLKSEKGKQLNDTIGTCLGIVGSGRNTGRVSVRTVRHTEMGDTARKDLWIKRENLKTVYGTCRSNRFATGIFEKTSRINHSCCPNTAMLCMKKLEEGIPAHMRAAMGFAPSKPGEYVIVSEREIRAGEELTLSYLGGQPVKTRSTESRREILCEKYCFTCECEACKKNEFC